MTRRILARIIAPSLVACLALTAPLPAFAKDNHFKANLESFQEVPAVSSSAVGKFTARLNKAGTEIEYELQYDGLESDALQAHIHFGQKGVNGGISVFICSNLGNGPAGTPACPLRSATLTGTFTAADVIGPVSQGISAGEFDELVEALREGVAYANVHSATFTGGEIRGQLK